MKTTQQKVGEIEKELMNIVRLIELDKDDGTPLYEDGDKRIGFKKQELVYWTEATLNQAREEERERIETLLVKEIAIAHQEGTPTSRLTSLAMKIKTLTNTK